MTPDQVFAALKVVLQSDPVCAANWRATLASAATDEGVDDVKAAAIAARFMAYYFEVT